MNGETTYGETTYGDSVYHRISSPFLRIRFLMGYRKATKVVVSKSDLSESDGTITFYKLLCCSGLDSGMLEEYLSDQHVYFYDMLVRHGSNRVQLRNGDVFRIDSNKFKVTME